MATVEEIKERLECYLTDYQEGGAEGLRVYIDDVLYLLAALEEKEQTITAILTESISYKLAQEQAEARCKELEKINKEQAQIIQLRRTNRITMLTASKNSRISPCQG